MDIESIKEYIKDILELVKDNLKPYLITLAIVFALAGGIILLFALCSVGFHVYIPIISEINDMNKELMVKVFFAILAVYFFAFCR